MSELHTKGIELAESWTYWLAHGASAGAIVAACISILPFIFALPAAIFYCIQIYRLPEVQNWKHQRRLRKIARYKAKVHELEAMQKERDKE